jgi:NAD(P)-dependent dehydrogenase (short-subunit alcohol dehydrogenase family)
MTTDQDQRHHALVIGASSGVGFAIAKRLCATHRVTAVARRIDRMQRLEELSATILTGDVSELETIAPLVESAVIAGGKLDVMVYCAGKQLIKPMRVLKTSEISDMVATNLTAAIICGRMFASPKVTNIGATFCAISSIAAQRPEAAIVPYSAAKAGLEALVKGLARECAPRRAIGIAPGWLDTEMTQAYCHVYNEAFRTDLEKRAPRGIATVEEVTDLVGYLLSPSARAITGQILTIDGGISL